MKTKNMKTSEQLAQSASEKELTRVEEDFQI
jgi:hypothetical protein